MGKAFNQDVSPDDVQDQSRPVIFALSNPTELAECTPEEAYRWSRGKAIYAAGVQFPPVHLNGKFSCLGRRTTSIYPAVGLAVYATRAKRFTDEMLIEAAKATAEQVTGRPT